MRDPKTYNMRLLHRYSCMHACFETFRERKRKQAHTRGGTGKNKKIIIFGACLRFWGPISDFGILQLRWRWRRGYLSCNIMYPNQRPNFMYGTRDSFKSIQTGPPIKFLNEHQNIPFKFGVILNTSPGILISSIYNTPNIFKFVQFYYSVKLTVWSIVNC